jgi:hypothetical protein
MPVAVVKIGHQGEFRRARLCAETIRYEDVVQAISDVFPLVKDYTAKYLDEEGDACTLCEATFPDFVAVSATARSSTVERSIGESTLFLKLELIVERNQASSANSDANRATRALLESLGPMLHAMGPMMELAFQGMGGMCKRRGQGKGKKHQGDMCQENHSGAEFLTPSILAGVVVVMLPKILPWIASACDSGDILLMAQMVLTKMPQLRELLQSLKKVLEKTNGLEQCAEPLDAFLQGNAEAAPCFLLCLATAIDMLTPDEQARFLESFFAEQWAHIQIILSKLPMEHWQHASVTCDGCDQRPINGPRFKCNTCENYDLCGKCFAKRDVIHDARCAGHAFVCIPFDTSCGGVCPFLPRMFTHCNGRGRYTTDNNCQSESAQYHEERDHASCRGTGENKNVDARHSAEDEKQEDEDAPRQAQRLAIPVMLDDGRQLVFEWETGTEILAVANDWVRKHQLPEEYAHLLVAQLGQ